MVLKKKTGQYVLYAAISALIIFLISFYSTKADLIPRTYSLEDCKNADYVSYYPTSEFSTGCGQFTAAKGTCTVGDYKQADASKCVSGGSISGGQTTPPPTGAPNFLVFISNAKTEYQENSDISYEITVKNIGGKGVLPVDSGVYRQSLVQSWYSTNIFQTQAMIPATNLPLCVSGETNVQNKAVTLDAGETQTITYSIRTPKIEPGDKYVIHAGTFKKCGESYTSKDVQAVTLTKSSGGTGGTAGATFEWPKITFLSDIGKWYGDRTTLEKSSLGAFILLIVIWYMFWSDFGKQSQVMRTLKVQELRARAEMIAGGKK